ADLEEVILPIGAVAAVLVVPDRHADFSGPLAIGKSSHGVFSSLCFAVYILLSPGGCRGGGAGPLDPVRPCRGVRLGAALSRRPFPLGWRGSPRTLLPGAVGRLRFACCGYMVPCDAAKVKHGTMFSANCTKTWPHALCKMRMVPRSALLYNK